MINHKFSKITPLILSALLLTGCGAVNTRLPWYFSSIDNFMLKMAGVNTPNDVLKINKVVTPNIYHEDIQMKTSISASLLGVTETSEETQSISIDRNGGNKKQITIVSDGDTIEKSALLTTETSEGTKAYTHDGSGWEETEEADKNMLDPLEITEFPLSATLAESEKYYVITIPGEDFFTSDMAGSVEASIEDFADGDEAIKQAAEDIFGKAEAVFMYNKDTFLLEKAELKGIEGDIPISSDVSTNLDFNIELAMTVEAAYSMYGEVPEIDVVNELKNNPVVDKKGIDIMTVN